MAGSLISHHLLLTIPPDGRAALRVGGPSPASTLRSAEPARAHGPTERDWRGAGGSLPEPGTPGHAPGPGARKHRERAGRGAGRWEPRAGRGRSGPARWPSARRHLQVRGARSAPPGPRARCPLLPSPGPRCQGRGGGPAPTGRSQGRRAASCFPSEPEVRLEPHALAADGETEAGPPLVNEDSGPGQGGDGACPTQGHPGSPGFPLAHGAPRALLIPPSGPCSPLSSQETLKLGGRRRCPE